MLVFLAAAYTGGLPFLEIKKFIPKILSELSNCDPEYRKINFAREHNHVFDILSAYETVFTFLAIMIGVGCSQEHVRSLLKVTGDAGQDRFFDRVAAHFDPGRTIGKEIKISQHYRLLVSAMDAQAVDQAKLVSEFLEGWFSKVYLKNGGFETHNGDAYTGYWSYEAAAVVMICGIDDSSFRDHKHYPDQLLAHYRGAACP
jgi:hypothetical protein